jgi:hypothetical protein
MNLARNNGIERTEAGSIQEAIRALDAQATKLAASA